MSHKVRKTSRRDGSEASAPMEDISASSFETALVESIERSFLSCLSRFEPDRIRESKRVLCLGNETVSTKESASFSVPVNVSLPHQNRL